MLKEMGQGRSIQVESMGIDKVLIFKLGPESQLFSFTIILTAYTFITYILLYTANII